MRVAVLGAGPSGSAMAALMAWRGHDVTLWSPRGGGTRHLGHELMTRGVLAGAWRIRVAADLWRAAEVAEAILIALPPAAQPSILQRLASALVGTPDILFAPAGGLAPALLHQFATARGFVPRLGALAVPPALAARGADGVVEVMALRPRLWVGGLPPGATHDLVTLTERLFGLPAVPIGDILAAGLAEPGALVEAARILAPPGVAHAVGRLLLGLAAERDAVGKAMGRHDLPGIAALVSEQGGLPAERRPLAETGGGLAFLEAMARASRTPVPLVSSALQVLETAAGESFSPHPVLAALEPAPLARLLGAAG
ncbi:NAD(P)-binding domain-containing protein [Roseococcus sp. SDR]|uniref:NAD(P)-binding domain-containing protein n=1 Tax=Roseococcus sp. SDR TaxID=2835532 RepID=UPI001BCAC8E3|nr:NAD(P)-binding domain-containing protein [Roseococcus sp. SDR]MBS7791738.1 NAD(P)-binding domain-containing protein [Roseococcus sp. SDR]MBV1847052.1 NAD(P)-binding domain-containing protein [Roseococcus sp. SDR]